MPNPGEPYLTWVPFTDYEYKNTNDIIGTGLTFGLKYQQAEGSSFEVFEDQLNNFKAGTWASLAAAIAQHAGMTLKYAIFTWDETYVGAPEGYNVYSITRLNLNLVVHADTAGNANSVLIAIDYPDWFHNFTLNVSQDNWTVYVLDPCPVGYHWDDANKVCVHDTCATGYHWDANVQGCVKDTSTNCPTGFHWDEALGKCVLNETQPDDKNFPWGWVLLGIGTVSAVGLGGYYLYKRSKRPKMRQIPQLSPSL